MLVASLPLLATGVSAQTLYKYTDENGATVYTDRDPGRRDGVEVRALASGTTAGDVRLRREFIDGREVLVARNTLHAPVQLRLLSVRLAGGGRPEWLLPPQSVTELRVVDPQSLGDGPQRYMWMIGDPDAVHAPAGPYRAPFPAAVSHRVSQAWPQVVTHRGADSEHAVDIAMPVGSDVLAARGGIVVETAHANYASSLEPGKQGSRANLVRILHDDGTFAVYAHLNWNSIRVRPGQRVARGEYIADSGNTGFSTGPHLHFVVMQNVGMRLVSLPVVFENVGGSDPQVPATGNLLTAH